MKLEHWDLTVEMPDAWWDEAHMSDFVPADRSYPPDLSLYSDREVFLVSIADIEPVRRDPGVGIFNDNEKETARERVLSILQGLRTGDALPPVAVVSHPTGEKFRYKLVDGTHRLYCSLAAGFSEVPAVWGFDINASEG